MKKTSLLFIVSTIISLPIFGMEIEKAEKERGIYPIPKELGTPIEQGLFIVAREVQSSPKKYAHSKPYIPRTLSHTTKNLYNVFHNPIIARDIIIRTALLQSKSCSDVANGLHFPGVIECLKITSNLRYKKNTPDDIEKIFNEGALINYHSIYGGGSALFYWAKSDKPNSVMIVEKLIALGADPNDTFNWNDSPFFVAIRTGQRNKLDALLTYYTRMNGTSTISEPMWGNILILFYNSLGIFDNNLELVKRLITNVPKEICSTGLKVCIDIKEPGQNNQHTQLMELFIARKANTGAALEHLLRHIEIWGPAYFTSDFIKDFNTLAKSGAYSENAINALTMLSDMFKNMSIIIEKNNSK